MVPQSHVVQIAKPFKSQHWKNQQVLLAKINLSVLSSTKINKWKNKSSVIIWRDNITSKQTLSFICFDVENFYPSISSNLFKESIEFARQLIGISADDLSIIMQAKKKFFLKVQYPRSKRVVMRNSTFQQVVSMALKYASYFGLIYRVN